MPGGISTERVGDRFELIDRIGTGGMATVWLAHDVRLDRKVALKRLYPNLAEQSGAAKRFSREAQAAAALNHPAIVTVYDVGEDDQGPYLVMEYIDGRTLAQELKDRKPLPVAEAVSIALACSQALSHAHQRGVIHRDVKPGNILLGADGSVRLTDFGIAKVAWETQPLTQTASLLGTASYLSPEQAGGGQASEASDIYSLGVVLYEMLTGRVPFPLDNPVAAAMAHTLRLPDSPGRLRPLPEDLERVVMRCLEKDPADRFENAAALTNALEEIHPYMSTDDDLPTRLLPTTAQESGPVDPGAPTERLERAPPQPRHPSRRRVLVVAGAAAVLALAALAWVLSNGPSGATPDPAGVTTPSVATTLPTTTSPSTTLPTEMTTLPEEPATFEEALVLLAGEVESLRNGQEIHPPFQRDLQQLIDEITREWDEDHDVDKTRERLDKLLDDVSQAEEEGRITSDAAVRVIEAGLQAIVLLPEDD